MKHYYFLIYSIVCLFSAIQLNAQYTVETNATAMELVNTLVGEGVEVSDAVLTCDTGANGIFEGIGDLGIDTGIVLTSGTARVFSAFTGWGIPDVILLTPGDSDLDDLVTSATGNACILEFDFVPIGNFVSFDFVFGSAEYGNYSCSNVNDVFGFFISGPGIVGTENLAVIPGTTIPICVNSTTGVGAWVTGDPDCTGMGPGSPFTAFYIDNTTGGFIRYGGFTTIFNASSDVTPCEEYHLKLAIADVFDRRLDSGVFLEANSLVSTSSVEVSSVVGGGGMPWPNTTIVRGCSSGSFTINRSGDLSAPLTVNYLLDGTAVNGTDYELLPGSVIIPAGASSVTVSIDPIVLSTSVGVRTVIPTLINPYVCGDIIPVDTLYIYDSLGASISIGDTVICNGEVLSISVLTDTLFDISWTADASLSLDPDNYNILVAPTTSNSYYLTLNMDGSGCDDWIDTITVDVVNLPSLTLDDTFSICPGESVFTDPDHISGSSVYASTFLWTPAAGVSNPSILNPSITPTSSGYYHLSINSGAEGCSITDSTYINLLPTFTHQIYDTICNSALPFTWAGGSVTVGGIAVDEFVYNSLVNGCDSTVYLNLYIIPDIEVTQSLYICPTSLPFMWNGSEITAAGDAVAAYTTPSLVSGCDSITTLNLNLYPTIETVINENICTGGSYTFFGTPISAAGTYDHTLLSYLGCDSVIILNLILDPIPTDTSHAAICEGSTYEFYGINYSTAGYYNYLETGIGCDTMRILDLVINPTYDQIESYTYCRNELPITIHGVEIPMSASSSSSYATITYPSFAGCDSIITIDITILDTSRTDLDTLVCYGITFPFGELMISEAGTYQHTLINADGCDSIISLQVAYTPAPKQVDEQIISCIEAELDGITYHNDTIVVDTFLNTIGCDSVYRYTDITILELVADTVHTSICDGDIYSFNGVEYATATVVTDTFIMDNGCDSFSTLVLDILPLPDIWLTYTPMDDIFCIMDTIHITGNGGVNYQFYDFDDRLLGDDNTISTILPKTQNIFFGIGYDENGCASKSHLEIMAEACCAFAMPNAFSPNGDGLNDKFGVITHGNPQDFKFEIYNRWGQRIFISFNVDDQWDGSIEGGQIADIGTYYFLVQGTCYDGSKFSQKGDATLVR